METTILDYIPILGRGNSFRGHTLLSSLFTLFQGFLGERLTRRLNRTLSQHKAVLPSDVVPTLCCSCISPLREASHIPELERPRISRNFRMIRKPLGNPQTFTLNQTVFAKHHQVKSLHRGTMPLRRRHGIPPCPATGSSSGHLKPSYRELPWTSQ